MALVYVLYVLAQASPDAIATSTKDPLLRRHPAGPTQGIPGQAPDHFIPPLETYPRSCFGAPTGIASSSICPVNLLNIVSASAR